MLTARRAVPLPVVLAIGLGMLLPASAGCQLPKALQSKIPDVAPEREARREDAITEFEQRRNDAQFQAAIGRRAERDWDGCRRELIALLERDPEHLAGRLMLAEVLLEQGQADAAMSHVQFVLDREPDNASAQRLAALVSDAASDAPPAATGVSPAGYEQSTPVTGSIGRALSHDVAEGARLLSLAQVDAARAAFDRAIEAAPDDPQIPISVAVEALRAGQTGLARDYLQAATARHAEQARLHELLGLVYYRRGELSAAQVSLQQALSLDNTRALSYFLLGSTLAKSGDHAAAEREFREAARRDRRFAVSR
ncbi:MAG: tetratricopeptide repeat protein [Pirellulales bacterium]|nr:tetratricopeptide repeat protein [Pirellulales bacterium]